MNKKLWFLTGFLCILAVLFSQTMFGATLFSDDFQDGNASGWSKSGGSWSVVSDDNYVYQQASTGAQAYSYTGNSAWTDYTVEVKAKALSFNGSSRSFGVTARYSSTSNYYYLVLNNSNQVQLGKKSSKGSGILVSKSFTVQTDTWYTLKLSVTGNELKGYVNGELLLSATDTALTTGKCGVLALYTSARFDNLLVDGTASQTSPSPTPTQSSVVSPSVPPTSTIVPTPTSDGTYPTIGSPVGWAAYNALGQNGTTGGAGGPIIHVYDKATLEDILYEDDNPAIIVIHGTLTGGPGMINVKSNKTIVGAGSGAYLNFGLYLRGSNIIIKNLDIMNGGFEAGDSEGLDAVTFASNLHHVWVDHCTMHETRDGLVDPTRNARFVTISYCYFHTQKTAVLIGAGDSDSAAEAAQTNSDKSLWHYTVSVHHNYWEGVYERAPRVRFGAVHVYNNFYNGNPNYAIGRGDQANIYSEANYFLNTHDAFAAYDDSSNPGYVDDVNSLFEGDNGAAKDNPPSGSWVWNPAQYYSYTPHSAEWV
ncbi:MAG TPA: family 16 glycoside hydrolase, partial [Bacillota bacterium]|nr:family 16 glycoside hydrolase [Bacillota bacterium]